MEGLKPRFRYLATCMENCIAEARTGTKSVQLSFRVTAELIPNQPPVKCERTLRADLWLSDSTWERTFKTLATVFGWAGTDLSELNERSLFSGTPVVLVCEEEEYNGDMQMKVIFINPQSSVYAVKPERAKEIADEFKGKLQAFRSKTKAALTTAADLAVPQGTDLESMDLPF